MNRFGVKDGHYRSEGFVWLSVISGTCADNLVDAVDRLLMSDVGECMEIKLLCGSPPGVKMADTLRFTAKVSII